MFRPRPRSHCSCPGPCTRVDHRTRVGLVGSILAIATLTLVSLATPVEVQGQDVLKRIGRRASRAAENELSKHVVDKVRGATRCALDDEKCASDARKDGGRAVFVDGDGNVITDPNGDPITDPEDARAAMEAPGTEVWRNYDFVPGSRVIYALDLTTEPVGRWPARQLEFVRGNGQVVEFNGEPAIEFSAATTFRVNLPEDLPDDFTIEIGYQAGAPNMSMRFSVGPEGRGALSSWDSDYVTLSRSAGVYREGNTLSRVTNLNQVASEVIPFALQVDGDSQVPGNNTDYAILYAGTDRVGQVPNGKFDRSRVVQVEVQGNQRLQSYLTHLVVAVHGPPLYDALTSAEGSFTTRGILFDFDSDRLRGESTPTLETILSTLEQYPDLTVTIEGHTDGSGEADYNQDLSERRAQALVDYLKDQGIEGDRLSARGLGETVPVADNETEAGRQQNRRVVIRNSGR